MKPRDLMSLTAFPIVADLPTRRSDVLARIYSQVEVEDEPRPGMKTACWCWTGSTSGDGRGGGYPRMKLDGQTVAVHRVVACHFFGYLHSKRQVDHKCRNRLCLNPHHLEPVTHKENQRRRDAAKAKGE